jgi:hypothetical protein
VVKFKIMEIENDGKNKVIGAPYCEVQAGEESTISVAKNEESGLFCTAIVNETEGGIEAVTTVVVKENGTEKLNTSQSITMEK